MGKLAKPLIIVVLVLSIVSLVLGITLFTKRETLKDRTQILEDAAVKVAGKLRKEIDAEALKDPKQMGVQLNLLATYAETTYDELQDTKLDLDNTKQELVQTQDALETAKNDLAASEAEVAELQSEVEAKEVELAQANTRVDQLEEDKAGLQLQIDDMNTKLVESDEEIRDLQDQIATLEQAYENVLVDLGDQPIDVPEGLAGNVVLVNPYWNFVVLDIGGKDGLSANAEMLVHRDDRLIGKVKISSVEDEMAIAEIVTDWEQVPIREGDHVLF